MAALGEGILPTLLGSEHKRVGFAGTGGSAGNRAKGSTPGEIAQPGDIRAIRSPREETSGRSRRRLNAPCDDAVPYRYKFCYRFRSSTTSVLGRTAPSLHLTELVSHHERDRYGNTNSDFVTVQYGMYVNRPHRCNEYNG